MIEVIIEVLGEFLVTTLAEILVRPGTRALEKPLRQKPSPWFAGACFTFFGALAGGLSLLVFPQHLTTPPWRVVNLVATPLAVGALMAGLGHVRARRGRPVLLIEQFWYGYLFALSFAVLRFVFCR